MPADPPYRIRFEVVSGDFAKEDTTTIKVWVKSLYNFPNIKVYPELPESFSLISNNDTNFIYVNEGDSSAIQFDIVPHNYGNFSIGMIAETMDSSVVESWGWNANIIYVFIRPDTSFWLDSLSSDTTDFFAHDDVIPDSVFEDSSYYSNSTYSLHISGKIWYNDPGWKGTPHIKMVLVKIRKWWPDKIVGKWYTSEDGEYDKTFNVSKGKYVIYVRSRGDGALVVKYYDPLEIEMNVEKSATIDVNSNKSVSWSPYLEGKGNNIARALTYIKKSREWVLNKLKVSPSFAIVGYGSLWRTSSYVSPLYSLLGLRVALTDRIYLKSFDRYTVSHEWGHRYQIMDCFSAEGQEHEKTPAGWPVFNHYYNTVSNHGHAIREGFAEFIQYAVWVDEKGIVKGRVEDFYTTSNNGIPYYKGEDGTNTDGTIVEGSIMQYFWDLGDDINTNDGDGDNNPENDTIPWDDEGLYNKYNKIGTVLKKIGLEVSAYKFPCRGGYIWQGDISIETFREKWDEEYGTSNPPSSSLVDNPDYMHELYDVTFYGTKPPAPSNLYAVGGNCDVELFWTDNAYNEGAFILHREPPWGNSQGSFSERLIPFPNTQYFDDYTGSGGSFSYKVAAMTCDTSSFSNTANIAIVCNGHTNQLGVEELTKIKVTTHSLYIPPESDISFIRIYNIMGECKKNLKVDYNNGTEVDFSDMPSGFYFVIPLAEDGKMNEIKMKVLFQNDNILILK